MASFEILDDRLTWRGDGETILIQAWGKNSLRTRTLLMADPIDTDYALLAPNPADHDVHIEVSEDGDTATITNGQIVATIAGWSMFNDQLNYHVNRARVSYAKADGTPLLQELGEGGSLQLRGRKYEPKAGDSQRMTLSFEANAGEKFYGMGQYQQEIFDLKGTTLELAHRNSQASVPFVLSSQGYGFLWHNPAIGTATFANNRTEWIAESSRQLDYWITAGDAPAQIISQYMDAVGHAPTMPEYGLGYWQCKLRYYNQEQLLEVAREHKRRGLPMDVIVADFFHWPKMGDFRFDQEFWPDPKAMVDELKELGIELMVSVWPQVSLESENYNDLKVNNLLVRSERGMDIQMGFQGPSAFIDVTNPRTRSVVWELCRKNYHDLGINLFWLDEAEPEYGLYDFENYRYHLGNNLEVGNVYPQAFARAFYEGQQQAGQGEVVNLLRCAWAGSARYGVLAWSGDISSTFTDLRRQITAGLHMGIAGIPWFTTDIGGFHRGNINSPEFRELLIRWFQFGAFCPVMRMHGDRQPYEDVVAADGSERMRSGAPSEVWSFGEETGSVLERYLWIRESLRPYLRSVMDQTRDEGTPVMRTLFYGFPEDAATWDINDQYLLGDSLLVAPVVEASARSRSVYLPAGTTWRCLRSGQVFEGGQRIEVDAPLADIPVFARGNDLADLSI